QAPVGQGLKALHGLLDERTAATGQIVQELRGRRAGEGPQASAGPTRGDDGVERLGHPLTISGGGRGRRGAGCRSRGKAAPRGKGRTPREGLRLTPSGRRSTCAAPSRSVRPSRAPAVAAPPPAPVR